jgi:hypothetical protein
VKLDQRIRSEFSPNSLGILCSPTSDAQKYLAEGEKMKVEEYWRYQRYQGKVSVLSPHPTVVCACGERYMHKRPLGGAHDREMYDKVNTPTGKGMRGSFHARLLHASLLRFQRNAMQRNARLACLPACPPACLPARLPAMMATFTLLVPLTAPPPRLHNLHIVAASPPPLSLFYRAQLAPPFRSRSCQIS